jgi:hypothetical protein
MCIMGTKSESDGDDVEEISEIWTLAHSTCHMIVASRIYSFRQIWFKCSERATLYQVSRSIF